MADDRARGPGVESVPPRGLLTRGAAGASPQPTADSRNIVVSGLTAAGKTTHALLVAKWLGYDYVSASQLMLGMLGIRPDPDNALWTASLSAIERMRDQCPADEEVNRLLAAEVRQRTRTVFDSWSLPWLVGETPCICLYIHSDLTSRSLKVRVSQEPRGPYLSLEECRALAEEKDRLTAVRLEPLLGVDIRTDRSVFDAVVDNSCHIDAPTIEAARVGITRFHTEIQQALTRIRGVWPPSDVHPNRHQNRRTNE